MEESIKRDVGNKVEWMEENSEVGYGVRRRNVFFGREL